MELTTSKYKQDKTKNWRHLLELYRDRSNKWRWRFIHRNGHNVVSSGENYSSYTMAARAAFNLLNSIQMGNCSIVKNK